MNRVDSNLAISAEPDRGMAVNDTGLGPLLADIRRGSPAVGVVLIVIALAMAAGCAWLARDEPAVLAGLMIPMVIAAVGIWGLRHRVRIHAEGVEVRDLFGEGRIRFDEADTLVHRTVAQRINGVPTGNYVWAQLSAGRRKVTFNLRVEKTSAAALEEFRARATESIAQHALDAMHAGVPFPWAGAATLGPEGLRYRPFGWIGRKAEQTVQYGGLRYEVDDGTLSVFPTDSDRILFTMDGDEPNFYPGLLVFESLCTSAPTNTCERVRTR
jgi:hypothetical protein